jgi:hypothetical protein
MTEIELESVGYYAKNLTAVTWYECRANDQTRRAVIIPHNVAPTDYKRVGKVNKVHFLLDDQKVYRYDRQVNVKPRENESRWFMAIDGEIRFLDSSADPARHYEGLGYSIMGGPPTDEDANDFLAARGRWAAV